MVTLCSANTDTLGLEETLDLGGDTATLGLEMLDLRVTLLHCYTGPQGDAGPRGHCCTATLLRWGPRGDAGPRGTAALLRWGPPGDAGTSGHCYTATLGSRGDMGPRGTTALLRWRSSRRRWDLGGTATLGASRRRWDLGALLHCYTGVSRGHGTSGYCCAATLLRWGPCGDAGTSGYCYTAARLRWLGPRGDAEPRGTATLLHSYAGWGLEGMLDLGAHCYTAAWLRWLGPRGDAGPRGTATLGGLEETLVPLGLIWTLVPLGSEETMDLGRCL